MGVLIEQWENNLPSPEERSNRAIFPTTKLSTHTMPGPDPESKHRWFRFLILPCAPPVPRDEKNNPAHE